jgi:hypothetical protein
MVRAGHDQLEVGATLTQVGDGLGDQPRLFVGAEGSEDERGLLVRLGLVSRPVVRPQWDASDVASAVALDEEPAVAIQGDDDGARPKHEPGYENRTDASKARAKAESPEIGERRELVTTVR